LNQVFLSKKALGLQKRPTPAELIEKEKQIDNDTEKRRVRYACGKSFTVPSQIERWDSYSGNTLASHIPEAQERAIKLEQKRIAMEQLAAEQEAERQERIRKKKEEKERRRAEGEEVSDAEEDYRKKMEEEFNQLTEKQKEERKIEEEERKKAREERRKRAAEDILAESQAKIDKTVFYPVNPLFNSKIALWKGDITTLEVDAIVNAANASLLGGGGVDGAIHVAAGPWLYEECLSLGGCSSGDSKMTRGYNLPARRVIHTVGPIGRIPEVLASAYIKSLDLAVASGVKTIAFCGISTGIYGYPLYCASREALNAVRTWLSTGDNYNKIDMIILCVYMYVEMDCYDFLLPFYFPSPETLLRSSSMTNISTADQEKSKQ